MKNKVILCLILLCITSNMYSQWFPLLPPLPSHSDVLDRYLYTPGTGISNDWLVASINDTIYFLKVTSFERTPIKGEFYLDMLSSPVKTINYWDSINVAELTVTQASERMSVIPVLFTDSSISFQATDKISMYIINAFTGDTTYSYDFPQPFTATTRMNTTNWTSEDIELWEKITKRRATDNFLRPGTVFINYVLPAGTYFTYFVGTDDGLLRWVEKIVKK